MSTHRSNRCVSQPTWHPAFLAMLPIIARHAKIAFRHLNPEARQEAVQEVVCNACQAYARLVELGKANLAYPIVLACYGVAQTKDGRKVGGRLNINDILSQYAQQRKCIVVDRLDHYDKEEGTWCEILVEDRRTGPFEIVRTKLDFAAWLQSLPPRLRRIARTLAAGETTTATARKFCVTTGRISQIRKELLQHWQRFQGELVGQECPAAA